MSYIIKSKAPVTAKEVVKLSYEHGTIDTIEAAKNVADEWNAGGGRQSIPTKHLTITVC